MERMNGEFPQNMADVMTRQKDIQFSSRTRANTDRFRKQHELRHNIDRLLKNLPEELKDRPEVKELSKQADSTVYNIVHLIYRNAAYEGYSKDFEFSRLSTWRYTGRKAIQTRSRHSKIPMCCNGLITVTG